MQIQIEGNPGDAAVAEVRMMRIVFFDENWEENLNRPDERN